jgi:hypothetical protein
MAIGEKFLSINNEGVELTGLNEISSHTYNCYKNFSIQDRELVG